MPNRNDEDPGSRSDPWAGLVAILPRLAKRRAFGADAWDRLHDAFLLIVAKPALTDAFARCSDEQRVPFVCGIARNVDRNARRSERRERRRSAEALLTAVPPRSTADTRPALRDVLRCIATLPPATREVFRRCIVGGDAPEEAAAALGTTESSVRSHLKRMRRAARESAETGDVDPQVDETEDIDIGTCPNRARGGHYG